jgi:hypothetical protein
MMSREVNIARNNAMVPREPYPAVKELRVLAKIVAGALQLLWRAYRKAMRDKCGL